MAGPNPFSKTLPLTSLGAVGGPTGTAAGTLRVLVDFIANYDGERVKELEGELNRLAKLEETNKQRLNKLLREQETLEQNIEQERDTRAKLAANHQRNQIAALKRAQFYHEKIEELRKAGASPASIRAYEGHLTRQVNALTRITGLSEAEIRNAVAVRSQREALEVVEERITANKVRQEQLEAGIAARQKESGAIEQFRAQAGPRLLGLGVGAIGGIFGGALFSVGWEAAQAGIDGFTNLLRDMIDPARHAREQIGDLASAMEAVASDEKLSNLEKAQEFLSGLGPAGTQLQSKNLDLVLQLVPATQKLMEINEQYNKVIEQGKNGQQVYNEQLAIATQNALKLTPELAKLEEAFGKLPGSDASISIGGQSLFTVDPVALRDAAALAGVAPEIVENFIRVRQEIEGAYNLMGGLGGATDEAAANAAAFADELERAANAAMSAQFDQNLENIEHQFRTRADNITSAAQLAMATVDRMAQNQIDQVTAASNARIDALRTRLGNLSNTPSARTRRLQDASSGGGDFESARTRALQARIEAFNKAQDRRAYLTQLAEIAEERYYIKFQRRLELQDKAIRISDYAGKRRVIAIEVSIAKLQQEADAQNRLNRLLDLQYEATKRIERQQGETIKEFLDRRAQEYRHQIEERVALDREERVSRLEELKTEADYRVELAENAQKRLEAIRARERKLHMDSLQAQLKASQEADRAAAAAQRDRLQKQLAASREADRAAYEAKRAAIQKQIDAEEKLRDDTIKAVRAAAETKKLAIELERDRRLKINEKLREATLAAEKKRQETITRFANKSEQDRLKAAMAGARTLAELNAVAGHLAGSNAAYGQLQSYVKGLGLNNVQTALLLGNIASMRAAYAAQLARVKLNNLPPVGGMAEGGVFTLSNAMNFGRNMRVGEQGEELGVVLSHRVADILQRSRGGPMIGTINIEAKEDPMQTTYRLRRMVRQAQEAQLT